MSVAVDYRSSAWSLRDAHATEAAMAALEAKSIAKENAAALAAARFAIDPKATRTAGDPLLGEGFRYLGTYGESASYFRMSPCDVFVDPDETTHVTYRRTPSGLRLSRYYVITLFDDGTCLETVARTKPIVGSSGALTVRAGSGDGVIADVRAHMEEVRRRVIAGHKVVPRRSLADVLRVSRYFVSHVISPEVASNVAATRHNERLIGKTLLSVVVLALFVIGAIVR